MLCGGVQSSPLVSEELESVVKNKDRRTQRYTISLPNSDKVSNKIAAAATRLDAVIRIKTVT